LAVGPSLDDCSSELAALERHGEAVLTQKTDSEPAAGLVELITNIVDEVLKKRRMRLMPAQAGMSKRQFATSIGVGVSTVEAAIRDGSLEAIKIGIGTAQTLIRR
jgi:hypothetical protein